MTRSATSQLRRHAQIVGARIRELSSKQYWSQFERSPDFVVLFLPGDQFLSAALAGKSRPDGRFHAAKRHARNAHQLGRSLKAVSYGWKQTILADNAAEIRRLGEELYKRLSVFGEHLGKIGQILGQQRRVIQPGSGLAGTAGTARGAPFSGTWAAGDPRHRAAGTRGEPRRVRRATRRNRTRAH